MKKEYRIAVAGTGYVGLSIAAPTNVYLKLSVAIWWSTVAYKTHAKYPYCEPVLLQSKVVTWYLHFSEELEVEGWKRWKPQNLFFWKSLLQTRDGHDNCIFLEN